MQRETPFLRRILAPPYASQRDLEREHNSFHTLRILVIVWGLIRNPRERYLLFLREWSTALFAEPSRIEDLEDGLVVINNDGSVVVKRQARGV
jgi:hypothetical protein